MLASYSLLIEKQNREIIRKNKQIEIWRTRNESELEQAAHVQNLLVPIDISNGAITSRCRYLREMSGDFHEIGEAEDGSTALIAGRCGWQRYLYSYYVGANPNGLSILFSAQEFNRCYLRYDRYAGGAFSRWSFCCPHAGQAIS